MLKASIGSGWKRREWVFGLRWVKLHSSGDINTNLFSRLVRKDPFIAAAKQQASSLAADGFALFHGEELLTGWPDQDQRLQGKEHSAGLALANEIGSGCVLSYFESQKKLYCLIADDGGPIADGELLISVDSEIKSALHRALKRVKEDEEYLGRSLPLYVSSNLMPYFDSIENRQGINELNISDLLGSIRKTQFYRLQQVKSDKTKLRSLLIVMIALILLVAGRDYLSSHNSSTPAAIPAIPIGPTPEQKYLSDLNVALSSTLKDSPASLLALYESLKTFDNRKKGWHATQLICSVGSCNVTWMRDPGGIPSQLDNAALNPLDGATTQHKYNYAPASIGLPVRITSLNQVKPAEYANEFVAINKVFPLLMGLKDAGFSVMLGQPGPLVSSELHQAPKLTARSIKISGGIAGKETPLLIESVSALSSNFSVAKVILDYGNTVKDDKLTIEATLITTQDAPK
ncbi:hypothetical protein [Chromobacterium vaccinii]|uniref:hypothetical protein n=1 Tax=Chromobacterium vaccinii TaxID=1108595 RepID=UPI003458D470